MKRKISGALLVTLGLLLIGAAALLYFHNREEDMEAGAAAARIVQELQAVTEAAPQMSATSAPISPAKDGDPSPTPSPLPAEMPVAMLDGYEYIGYLQIPDVQLNLPVMAQWDYNRLRIAPCRQFGSSRTDDLVIAAHNYESHFGNLNSLPLGAGLTFTDMDGIINRYTLQRQETIPPDEIERVQNSGYALVLYTCTKGGASRVTLFFSRDSDG